MPTSLALLMSWGPATGRSNSTTAWSAWNVLIVAASPGCRSLAGRGLPNRATLNGAMVTKWFGGAPNTDWPNANTIPLSRSSSLVLYRTPWSLASGLVGPNASRSRTMVADAGRLEFGTGPGPSSGSARRKSAGRAGRPSTPPRTWLYAR